MHFSNIFRRQDMREMGRAPLPLLLGTKTTRDSRHSSGKIPEENRPFRISLSQIMAESGIAFAGHHSRFRLAQGQT